MARPLLLVLALALTGAPLAGCGSGSSRDDREVLLLFQRSGGLGGVQTELRCHRDGQCEYRSGRAGAPAMTFVSDEELDRVRDALDEAGFSDLESTSVNGGGADFVTFDIVYEGHGVTMTDIHPIPQLRPVLSALEALAGQVLADAHRSR